MRTSETSDFANEQFLWNLFLDLHVAQQCNYYLCSKFAKKFRKKKLFSDTINKINNTLDLNNHEFDISNFEDELYNYENSENSSEDIINYCLKFKNSIHYNKSMIECLKLDFMERKFSEEEFEKLKKANIVSFRQDDKSNQIKKINSQIINEKYYLKKTFDLLSNNQNSVLHAKDFFDRYNENPKISKTFNSISLALLDVEHELKNEIPEIDKTINSLTQLKTTLESELKSLTQLHEMLVDEITFIFDKNLYYL